MDAAHTQGPYVTLGLNSVCPDDQILTLRQCAQAVWSGVVTDADPVRAPQTYGCGNIFENSPRGCNVWVGGRGNKMVYYNPSPAGRANPEFKAICSVHGGRLAEKEEEVTLPAGGVEQLPASTECAPGTLLTSLDQCKLAVESLGLAAAMKYAYGYPHWTTFQNELSKNRAVDQQAAPLGCTQFNNNLVYWNMDTKDDFYKSAPHHWRRPICAKVPMTTTTPAPATSTTTPAPATTTADANTLTCPCTSDERLMLKTPEYSNLGGNGPDTGSPEAVLYPEAGTIQGKTVNVKLWTDDAYAGKTKMNGVKGALGRLNMKTKQEVTFKIAILDASTGEVVPLSTDLPMTFLDLDEGKNAKGRGTLTVCNSQQFAPDDSELAYSTKDGCNSVSSTTAGTAKDNPNSVEGALSDSVASKRA